MKITTYTKNIRRLAEHVDFYLNRYIHETSANKLHYYKHQITIYNTLYVTLMKKFLEEVANV